MQDLTDLISDLTASRGCIQQHKEAFLEDVGKQIADVVKTMTPVDSGDLRDSITHKISGSDTVEITTNVEYAPYVDMGHVRGSSFVKGIHMFDKAMLGADSMIDSKVKVLLDKINILG